MFFSSWLSWRVFEDAHDLSGNPITILTTTAIIYMSNDGLSWRVSREQTARHEIAELPIAGGQLALSCDKAFYYDQFFTENFVVGGVTQDQIFRSYDGTSWGMVSDEDTGGSGFYESRFPFYCIGNDCLDSKGQHVPDGIMRHDQVKEITAQPVVPPTYFYGLGQIDGASGTNEITITKLNAEGVTVSDTVTMPGIANVFCVPMQRHFYGWRVNRRY